MKTRDHTRLLAELAEAYTQHSPKSAALNEKAKKYLLDGGSHALRLMQPFPPRIVAAQGAWLKDEDGHDILDFWQGHLANILGHNPEVVTSALASAFEASFGLQTGFTDRLQAETAEILCQQTGAERVRFTTSGTLATMYAILLARTFTERDLVMKVGGGWHGAQPWGLKGISFYADNGNGFERVETHGLPPALTDEVVITRFNDPDRLRDHFRQYGDSLACFIVEPFIGSGGLMPASREYLQTARELTHQYGAVLILDEVIAGFRFHAGNAGALYGVQADLATFGKVIGGGMPVSAVAGRADILGLVGREGGSKVKFSGGTYSAHPASLLAAKTAMSYLVAHEEEIYPRLAELGQKTRRTLETAFVQEGIYARCTGYGNEVLTGSSMAILRFPYEDDTRLERPEDVFNPAVCDVVLGEKALQLALLLEDVHVVPGHGAVSTAHTEADIDFLSEACRRVARRFKAHL
ncbi:MAG: aminotransferase class III-fold pyridoxal phosphate-dependent enzyme [Anaerolineales bacterium]|nr:MAG: aminotransferase class III-fold pyridoxal phosphate-dependent enzyme [Anaerolineales bacterium]